jgi:hypothetical protein
MLERVVYELEGDVAGANPWTSLYGSSKVVFFTIMVIHIFIKNFVDLL